jgi:ATP-dependent DNA helicase RecQ
MLEAVRPKTPLEALQRFFGYPAFRPGQEEIIASALSGQDTLVVMPTGGGKSLCYQVPALLCEGVTIVVSPLIALMKDQVDALELRGVRATTINSMLGFGEVQQRMTDIRYGLYSLVYVAPERFESKAFLELLKGIRIALFAVDEAHCISEWGHDFRPSYMKLRDALEMFNRPPVVALTATATPYVQEDIITQLGLVSPRRFVRGFDRPNLSYNVIQSTDKDGDLRVILRREMGREGSSIVYCGTRKTVEGVGMMLHAEGLPVTVYHAGMPDADRHIAQDSFIAGRARIIVATNAFGMGIDKANVRHVVHYDMPGSIEAYYQEAGRGGRDGAPSDCTLLYNGRDRRLQEFFIRTSFPDRQEIEPVYDALWDSLQIAVGMRYEGIFVPAIQGLAARSKVHPVALQSILGILEKSGVLRRIKAERLASVKFIADSQEIQSYYRRTRDEDRKQTIIALLRTLGGAALGQETLFNPDEMIRKHGLTMESFDRGMRGLMMGRLLQYTPPSPGAGYQFIAERLAARKIPIDEGALEKGRDRALLKLDAVERYIRTVGCRRDFILEYFHAEHEESGCGRCDNCRRAPQAGSLAGSPAGTSAGSVKLRPQVTRAIELMVAAVYELGGRFGKMTVVDVLRGQRNKTIDRFELQGYHRFGELHDMDRGELSRIADALVDHGLIEVSATLMPTVRVTPAGEKSIRHLSLKKFSPRWKEPDVSRNPDMLRQLQAERDRIARRDSLSPDAVCPDAILLRLSNDPPASRAEFMKIEGMTEGIYNACGTSLLTLLESLGSQEWMDEATRELPDRLRRTYMLHESGCELDEIARRLALQPSTVSGHLEELIKLGIDIDIDRFVPSGIVKSVRQELGRIPNATLRELRALVGGGTDYPELRIAAAWVRFARQV